MVMTSYVAGIQLATSSLSVAVLSRRVDGCCIATTATFTSRVPGDERAADLAAVADRAVCAAELAMIGPSTGSPADHLRSLVLGALRARGVQVSTVPATELGNATDLWPELRTTTTGEATALSAGPRRSAPAPLAGKSGADDHSAATNHYPGHPELAAQRPPQGQLRGHHTESTHDEGSILMTTNWVTLAELKNDQTLDGQITSRDDEALQRVLDAAMSWVMEHRTDLDYHGAWSVPADVRLGTIRLAARWFIRRVSPDGMVQLGENSSGMVQRTDPDIYMQLGIVGGLA